MELKKRPAGELVEIYRDEFGRWRWRHKDRQGCITRRSSGSYYLPRDAEEAVKREFGKTSRGGFRITHV